MSTIAVFVVLGGGAYAATKLPKNSVGTKQIKNGQVRSADLGANSVSSPKVKNGTLRREDFRAGELSGGAGGTQGPPGAQGTPGTDGTPGAPGRDGAALVQTYRTTQAYDLSFGTTFTNVFFTTGDTWTQPANALDYFFGRARLSYPTACQGAGEDVHLNLRLYAADGTFVTLIQDQTLPYTTGTGGWYNLAFLPAQGWLVPPGADTQRKLLAQIHSNCASADKNRLLDLRIDVVRAVGQ